MKASVGPEADRELTDAAVFYIGALWKNHRRRFPLRKFPYSVIYYGRGDEVRVVALAHHRRKPGYWASRK